MLQKKVCMIGSFAVGKTSLVARFVHSIFSEQYHTTIGVKIDKKEVRVGGNDVSMVLWDIHGDDEFRRIHPSYLRGASGCILVADGTRPESWRQAMQLRAFVQDTIGAVPFVLALNKKDLAKEWKMDPEIVAQEMAQGQPVIETSAKDGLGVEEVFSQLARQIFEGPRG